MKITYNYYITQLVRVVRLVNFCGPYFTVQPKYKINMKVSFPARPIYLRDLINKLNKLIINKNLGEKTRSVTYCTDRENEVSKRY